MPKLASIVLTLVIKMVPRFWMSHKASHLKQAPKWLPNYRDYIWGSKDAVDIRKKTLWAERCRCLSNSYWLVASKGLERLGHGGIAELKSLGNRKRCEVTNNRSLLGMRPFRTGQKWHWAAVKSSAAWVHCKDTRPYGELFSITLLPRTASPSHLQLLLPLCPFCYQKWGSSALFHLPAVLCSLWGCWPGRSRAKFTDPSFSDRVFTFIALNTQSYFKLQCE